MRHRLGSVTEGMDTRFFTSHEREDLVKRMENEKEKVSEIKFIGEYIYILILYIYIYRLPLIHFSN